MSSQTTLSLSTGSASLTAGTDRLWIHGLIGAAFWAATAAVTVLVPDVVPWGSTNLFATLVGAVAGVLAFGGLFGKSLGILNSRILNAGPWVLALGVWFFFWELTTAKFGWLPKPFFSPPQGLLNVYATDGTRLLICVLYTLRLWSISFVIGTLLGYALGIALGWSKTFAYWGMPVLKLIGPVPASAWIPVTFYFFPTTFDASIFIIALSCGIPVAILTASGVGAVNRSYYDVARNLGAKPWFLIRRIAIPASLPHVFVGLFMGLYYSFAVLVVAEMLGAKFGLGWYIQFQTAYSGYANVYATLVIMAAICAGLVSLLFAVRNRLLGWQKGFIA